MFYSFTGQSDRASYESPDGEVRGTVHLKRNLAIRKQTLQRIVDSYTRGGDNLSVTDEFLLYRLEENKDSRLRDIVSTIQLEQDQIIRADRNKALVIQGVPGSGKTTVALHRLAYLLYQYHEQMRPDKIIIFAPNQMFLDYISDVLPELGGGGVQQTTFTEWALQVLGGDLPLQDQAERYSGWFDHHKNSGQTEEELAYFKGSIRFLNLLKATLDHYEAAFVPKMGFIPWEGAELSEDTIHEWFYNEYRHYPIKKRQERVFARIKRWIEMEHREIRAEDSRGVLKKQAGKRLKTYMKAWPKHTLLGLYRHLLTTPLPADSGFADPVPPSLMQTAKKKEVKFEDLAPLLYIHNRLYGIDNKYTFDHIVIDEAQDFSPFQVAVLKEHCSSQSFTILGDLLQNIYPFQGIRRWQEILDCFPDSQSGFYQLEKSYRSTMEIIHFANEIIAPYNNAITPAKPVFRSGEPVRVTEVDDAERLRMIGEEVRRLLDRGGAHTVAVVARTEQGSREIFESLRSLGLEANLITTRQTEYRGGLSVAPVYLIKGMEFDAVLLCDVNQQQYPDNDLSAKLLYVGCTRALHQLQLVYSGNPSPLIQRIPSDLYTVGGDHG
ncbi:HelD family protein [Paenactinomyces guangxiensis]|uniref:HelD family protein n=1 Tax=Paenactinomyces guangxiensis TaxID=1490290 RepID=UPI002867BA94|nr:3'-5' exonuclease [Paenactinomyces guangxiensis]